MPRFINFTDGVLFKASKDRAFSFESRGTIESVEIDNKDFQKSDYIISPTASFRFDPIGHPLKSTQQLNVDWSRFENHTFFNSARSKVHITFDKILNGYPFDGTFKETIEFLDSLSGFEKWVFDKLPKNNGFLIFSGSGVQAAGQGTYLSVSPFQGEINPNNNKFIGEDKLSFGTSPFSIEFCIFVPAVPVIRTRLFFSA